MRPPWRAKPLVLSQPKYSLPEREPKPSVPGSKHRVGPFPKYRVPSQNEPPARTCCRMFTPGGRTPHARAVSAAERNEVYGPRLNCGPALWRYGRRFSWTPSRARQCFPSLPSLLKMRSVNRLARSTSRTVRFGVSLLCFRVGETLMVRHETSFGLLIWKACFSELGFSSCLLFSGENNLSER